MFRPLINTGITIFILAWALPTIDISNWLALLLATVVLTICNYLIKPILSVFLIPINLVTFGFAAMVLNVGLLWLTTYFVPGFQIDPMVVFGLPLNQFFSLVFASFLISFTQSVVRIFI